MEILMQRRNDPFDYIHNDRQKHLPPERHKSTKQRKKSKRVENFLDRLNCYSTIVFEKGGQKYDDFVERCYFLENKWTDILDEHAVTSRKKRLQQQAIWEFFVTERNYIKKLRVIVEVFQQYFKLCQSEGDLLEVNQSKLFANISEVLLANDAFWTKHLRPILASTRQTRQLVQPSKMLASFNQFETMFRPYIQFCLHQDNCLKYLREMTEPTNDNKTDKYKNFKDYLAWCETLPQCERFKLRDLMTEPMQRMTRYPLLLKKVRKETEDECEKEKLTQLISKAEKFISNINTTLRKRFENEKMEKCLQQFEYYTTSKAASEDVKWTAIEFLRANIQCLPVEEQRCILKRGSMKLIEKKGRNETDIIALLFTDVLVLAKLKRSTNQFHIIRQLFFLDKITLVKSQSSSNGIVFIYLDEYGLLATTFMLEVPEDERDTWIATIERAKVRYENARIGEGSTLDFFNDDYYIPANAMNVEIKEAIDAKTQARYENTLDRLNAKYRENNLKETAKFNSVRERTIPKREPIDRSQTFREQSSTSDKNLSRIRSAPESVIQDWVLKSEKRPSLPDASDIEKLCREKNRKSADSGVSVRTCSSIPEISTRLDDVISTRIDEEGYQDVLKELDNHLYEDIEKFQNGEKVDSPYTKINKEVDNNNNTVKHILEDISPLKRRYSKSKYFTTAECQTDALNTNFYKDKPDTSRHKPDISRHKQNIQTQTDISFSTNLFAFNGDDSYLENV